MPVNTQVVQFKYYTRATFDALVTKDSNTLYFVSESNGKLTAYVGTEALNYEAPITGGASTVVSSNLTANRALVSDGSGKIVVSAVTSTEIGYLDGVTSAIQTQLDGKIPSRSGIFQGTGFDTAALFANVITNASTGVGFEYNILLNAVKKGYTISESGSALSGNPAAFFDGMLAPQYSSASIGLDELNPYVLLIEGLPNVHTQTGGIFGWTSRYWYPTKFKVEGYNVYGTAGWVTLKDQTATELATKDLVIPMYPSFQGQYTKFRITIYKAGGSAATDGKPRWGLSEIFFIHPEAQATHQYLNVEWAKRLSTAITINGVSFDGSANITVYDSSKLPLSGGTLSGSLSLNQNGTGGNSFSVRFKNGLPDGYEPYLFAKYNDSKLYRGVYSSMYALFDENHLPDWTEIDNKPTFATVATSGSYNDLSNLPTIPSIPSILSVAEGSTGTASTQRTINAVNLKEIILVHSPAGARPASDVSAWAKAAEKPAYTYTEVGAAPASLVTTVGNHLVDTTNPHQVTAAQAGAMSTSHAANAITSTNISNWNTAYGWGNHATVGYLTAHPVITTLTDTSDAVSPGYAGTFTVVDSVTRDSNGHTTKINLKTITMPAAQSIPSIPAILSVSEGSTGTASTQRTINAVNLKEIILVHSPAGARPASSIDTSVLGSSTPSGTTFLAGDRSWKSVAFSAITGTATESQIPTLAISKVSGLQTALDGKLSTAGPLGEAFLSWGGKNLAGTYAPIDSAMVNELGANRLAFMPAGAITIEYSRDSGSTWLDYGATDAQKINFLNGVGSGLTIGKNSTTGIDYSSYRLRVTIATASGVGNLYTNLNKFVILVSTSGSTGSWCTIDARTQQNYLNTVDTWVTFASQTPVSGWSGYNVINTTAITTFGNTAASQYGQIRFTFGGTGYNPSYTGLQVIKLLGFGGVGWTTPSNLAKYGAMYTYDHLQNVTFPASVYATSVYDSSQRVYSPNNKPAVADVVGLQAALDAKQATVTGAATTIVSSNLTASRAVISDSNGKVAVSAVTSTEIGYLDGVTSNIQDQLNAKVSSNTAITGATKAKITFDAKGLVTGGADLVESDIPSISVSKLNPGVANLNKFAKAVLSGSAGWATIETSDVNGLDTALANKLSTTGTAADSSKLNGQSASYYQVASTAITTSNISSQSVSYAASAGSAATLSSLTATVAELNFVGGVTSNIQTQLNAKVAANTAITAGTFAKITFDAKGLVTGGSNLISSDIPSLPVTHLNPGISNVGKFAKATSSTQAGWATPYDSDIYVAYDLDFLGLVQDDYLSDAMNGIDWWLGDLNTNKAPKNMPLNAFTTSTYLTSAHYNNLLYNDTTSAITLYLQSAPVGTEIHFLRYTTGEITISPASGQTLVSEGNKRRINAQYQAATAKCIAANTWVLFGALKT